MILPGLAEAEKHLDRIEQLACPEIENVQVTISAVESDSRLGRDSSMKYVCNKWHLEWKIRQVNSTLREIADYQKMLHLHQNGREFYLTSPVGWGLSRAASPLSGVGSIRRLSSPLWTG